MSSRDVPGGLTLVGTVPAPTDADYWFLGGTIYRTDADFSMEPDGTIEYPFTTYYRRKFEPFRHDGIHYRPLAELVCPLLAVDHDTGCTAAVLDPVIQTGDGQAYPFIGYDPDAHEFRVVVPERYAVREKDAAWLGTGSRRTVANPDIPAPADHAPEVLAYDDWQEAVFDLVSARSGSPPGLDPDALGEAFRDAARALGRSWDAEHGTFLQLPWRDRPGFALAAYSYGLVAHEAERLALFAEHADLDGRFPAWRDRLADLFRGDALTLDDLTTGEGTAWYNMTMFDGDTLQGKVYLGTGYYGYPGGQATIARALLDAADDVPGITGRAHATLEYILATQNGTGGWPKALRHERELPVGDDPWTRESEGATAESVRALLSGYERFDDDRYRAAAERGLERLATDTPVCRNGLRDIGSDEPEGFSAFAAVHAFLDAHETLDADYLADARTYAAHLLTWTYWSETGIDLRGVAHPIAETITMRISPYETLLAARAFRRMSDATGEKLWDDLYDRAVDQALRYRNPDGGLSEGIFFDHDGSLFPLATEQTFATAELVRVLADDPRLALPEREPGDPVPVVVDGKTVRVPALDLAFDAGTFRLERVDGDAVDAPLRFAGPYTFRSRAHSKLMSLLRGHDLLAGLRHLDYPWRGVHPRDRSYTPRPLGSVPHTSAVDAAGDAARFRIETSIHTVAGAVRAEEQGGEVEVRIPFEIRTHGHDLLCSGVDIPLPGFEAAGDALERGDVTVEMDAARVADGTLDLTLSGNWTHGGLFEGELVVRG